MDGPLPKRVKVGVEHPINLLFSTWLKQWKTEAESVEGHMRNTVHKALKSLNSYPLALQSGKEAKILNGFGDFLCTRLEEELVSFRSTHMHVTLQCVKRYIKIEKGTAGSLYNKKRAAKGDKVHVTSDNLTTTRKELADNPAARCDTASKPDNNAVEIVDYKPISNDICESKQAAPRSTFFKRVFSDILDDSNETAAELDKQASSSTVVPAKVIIARSQSVMTTSTVSDSAAPKSCFGRQSSLKNAESNPVPQIVTASSLTVLRTDSNSSNSPEFVLNPGEFSIQLIVDFCETIGKSTVTDELTKLGVNFREERLATGDYLWVARSNIDREKQLVLDVIVERKRIDDLAHSITDGTNRYREQKVRLKQSGIRNIVFLVEKHAKSKRLNVPIETLYQAICNTQLHDAFYVKITENGRDTAAYLASVTKKLTQTFSSRILQACSRNNLPQSLPTVGRVELQTLTELQSSSGKSRPLSLQELLLRQLMVFRGMTAEKAYSIVNHYTTFANLRASCLKNRADTATQVANINFGNGNKKVGLALGKQICDFMLYC